MSVAVGAFSVVLSGDPQGFASQVAQHLSRQPEVFGHVEVHDHAQALEQRLAAQPPHLVTLDLGLSGLGGAQGAERLVRWYRGRAPASPNGTPHRVVVISPLGDDELVARAFGWGVDYFVVRPFDVPTMGLRLRQLLTGEREPLPLRRLRRRHQIEVAVVRYMEQLGVPTHYKGRAYLKEAVVMVVERRELLDRVTKELYPRIAVMHRTAPFKVERAIRHAIEITVQRGNLAMVQRLFANLMDNRRGRPTNSSFIARLADQVRLEVSDRA